MTQKYSAPNNLSDVQYQQRAEACATEWRRYANPSDGDFIVLERPSYLDRVYVFYSGRLYLIGDIS